jgi:NitT/TauT family transport system substrate-binding protein
MLYRLSVTLLLLTMLAACGATSSGPVDTGYGPAASGDVAEAQATSVPGAATTPTNVIMAMPFIPSVQFAHFYLADQKGYYAAEGLKVTFDYNFETDVVQRVAQQTVQFGLASGDSVLLARSQELPVVTVFTNSQKFPVVFFSKAANNIKTPADLKGKTVGIPGRFGASYIGLRALLYANNLQESDLTIQEIGFTQAVAVNEDKVQVAAGYGNNEPIQLQQQGVDLNVIRVFDSFPLASDGLIASEKLIAEQPEVVRGFVRATLKGMADVIADPDAAFEIALQYVPEAKRGDPALQRQVLQATLGFWQSDLTAKEGLGMTDMASWDATHTFLRTSAILKSDVALEQAFTNQFVK